MCSSDLLSGNSLIGNANLITKVYFPRMLIPAAAVMAGLADLAIAFVLMFLLLPCYGMGLRPHLLMLPVLVALTTLLAIGAGMWLSALNVKFRDIRYAIPFAVQLLMFATPIIYPSTLVPARWRWLLLLNPLAALIEGYRAAFFGRPFAWGPLGLSAAMILGLLLLAAYDFKRMENTLADLV